jgi:hypothetical protein
MPKKSIDRNPITIVSSQGTDASGSDTSLIGSLDTSVVASEVISSNSTNEYLGYNVQLNLDDLTSEALESQPPKIGFGPITFSNGSVSTTHDGRPDWGQAKVIDSPPWLTLRKKWAEKFEMPHYFTGLKTAVNSSFNPKWINEGGIYDTVNINYRDLDDESDHGLNVFGLLPNFNEMAYRFNNFPVPMQSVPRSSFSLLNPYEIYPYLYQEPFVNDDVNDFFNASTDTTLGLNAGVGTASLGVKNGQASINLGSPLRTTSYSPYKTEDLSNASVEAPPRDVGVVISGVLFPADRGVLALVRFPSNPNDVASSFVGTPATTVADIELRVISAIKLGKGAGTDDGLPGDVIFNNSATDTFPSRKTGQYDLYELHTGNYTTESTRSGAIADLGGVPNKHSIGKVRLLSDANAFDGSTTRVGGIPVLFSPYEKIYRQSDLDSLLWADFYQLNGEIPIIGLGAYVIDNTGATLSATINTATSAIDIDAPNGNTPYTYYAYVKLENRNFLSYRLPVLKNYSPNGLETPQAERDRFFIKRKPNTDQDLSQYDPNLETAGEYITFGEENNYSFQVARYRQVITLTRDYHYANPNDPPGGIIGLSADDSEPEYNFGSLALIHFKTERAFEALIRDGVAPSDEDVYSKNLIDYTDLNKNVGRDLGTSGDDGLDDGVASYSKETSMSIFRPNLNFMQKIKAYPKSINLRTEARSLGVSPLKTYNTIERSNTYFMWASGVIYVNPSSWLAYKGHRSNMGGSFNYPNEGRDYSKFQATVQIEPKDPQGNESISEWDGTNPTSVKPFTTVRPTYQILSSDLTATNNLVADDRWNYSSADDTGLPVYPTASKHQQIWASSGDLAPTDTNLIEISVRPKGDAVKPFSDLTQYDPKDGLCTFSTNGLRPSVMVNNPHRQFENLGVHHIMDNLDENSTSEIKKLLYHSARKVSLLELCGERFTPSGFEADRTTAVASMDDVYTPSSVDPFATDPNLFGQYDSTNLLGSEYRDNDHSFVETHLFADWENTNNATQVYNPKTSGQAFSIYRYDDEGYKVYVELELLPIGGDENLGYALELCSGWDWVDNTDSNVNTKTEFKYKQDVPVYRPVENNHTRTSANTHWDAKFISVIEESYYIECHPSIPYDYVVNPLGSPLIQNADPKTEAKSSIFQLGNADATADLGFKIQNAQLGATPLAPSAYTRREIYKELGSGHYDNDQSSPEHIFRGEPLPNAFTVDGGTPDITGGGTFTAEEGATVHLNSFFISLTMNSGVLTGIADPPSRAYHPQDRRSTDANGLRSFGHSILEVKPTGNRELPEYGNFTMDRRGYITVSGMGNNSNLSSLEDLYPDGNNKFERMPLVSLFSPRKDTQERFLDESYRIEHSLNNLFKNGDVDSSYQFGNHTDVTVDPPIGGNTELHDNLKGPGIPNFGSGANGGYISLPVRDELVMTNYAYLYWTSYHNLDGVGVNKAWSESIFPKFSFHGYAGYLKNSLHMKRITITPGGADDWYEAQVVGFPNMTRNHLSGAKYGTPPRGVLIYPYQDFNGLTTTSHGYDLSNSGAGTVNPLLDSDTGFFLPNSNSGIPQNVNHIDSDHHGGSPTWIDDDANNGGTAQYPPLRYAQPNYSGVDNTYPDVGYLRAFDLNFGKSKERSAHLPYWNTDWVEQTNEGTIIDRNAVGVEPQGQIESGAWKRHTINEEGYVSPTPIKLRLVGIDWDMISYVDPQHPNSRKDGTVYTIDSKRYLMRKRVMRVFVKVPGLTTWLDVGVMNGEVGESYVQYVGDPTGTFGGMNEEGATSDKTHSNIDGAGCCVAYKETFLVEEGLVALDLDLDVGYVPAFNTLGTADFLGNADSEYWLGSKDTLIQEEKVIWVGNSTRHYGDSKFRKWGVGSKEAPILVKVVLSPPEYPSYETHPSDASSLVDRNDLTSTALVVSDIANDTPANETIYDIWSAPNKSYRGHSFPPDDRSPTWARRGLMGIEVLRQDGSNYDYEEVVDRPEFCSTELFGENQSLYMSYFTATNTGVAYQKVESEYTNQITYTISQGAFAQESPLASKGKG